MSTSIEEAYGEAMLHREKLAHDQGDCLKNCRFCEEGE